MKKYFLAWIAALLVLSLLAGCGGSAGQSSSGGTGGGSTPSQGQASEPPKDTPPASSKGPDTSGLSGKLAGAYIDMLAGGSYYMKYRSSMEMDGEIFEMTGEMAVRGDEAAMKSSVADTESLMIMKDSKIYIVNHEAKMVMIMQGTPTSGDPENGLPMEGYVFKESGTAELFGVPRAYEQYATDANDVRFYFDGNKLIGFEAMMEDEEMSMTAQMEILELSNNIPGEMFNIPAGYTQQEISY